MGSMSIFEDKKIKNMSWNRIAWIALIMAVLTGIMSYFVWKYPNDLEAWVIAGSSLFMFLYCGWYLILKWDSR
jgi:uncharacterized membrane protein